MSKDKGAKVETDRPLGTPTVATPGDVIRAQPKSAVTPASEGAILNDPALANTPDTGESDRARDFGEPAPDGEETLDDRLGEPQTNTGIFAGALAGAVIGGAGGPIGSAAGAVIGGVVGGAIGAATVHDHNDEEDDAGAAGDVADVDSDHDRIKRTYSGQIYEAGSLMDVERKDEI